MPGMLTSSSTSANSSFISRASASMPERALIRFWPSSPRIVSYDTSRAGWSSTSRMFTLSAARARGKRVPSTLLSCDTVIRSAVQPHPHQRPQLLGVDRLGDVVRSAAFQALLAVALHRLRGEGDDRQQPELRIAADPPHRLVAVPSPHHLF